MAVLQGGDSAGALLQREVSKLLHALQLAGPQASSCVQWNIPSRRL